MTNTPTARNPFARTLLALLFLSTGTMHFLATASFAQIVPPFLPHPVALVYLTGLAELALALGLLFQPTRRFAAWSLVVLLIAVFPANVYMLHAHIAVLGHQIPAWLLWIRLPLQLPLIGWAYLYTRDR